MKKTKVHVEEFDDVLFDWITNAAAPGPDGSLVEIGTVVRVNNQLIALSPLTPHQLDKLEEVVLKAISHERSIRDETKLDPNLT